MRRTISWLATISAAALATFVATRLPGWRGPDGELQWLLSHRPQAREMNRASILLLSAERRTSGSAARLLHRLLRTDQPAVVDSSLVLIGDLVSAPMVQALRNSKLPASSPYAALSATVIEEFRAWLTDSSPETKLRHCERAAAIAVVGGWLSGLQADVFNFQPSDRRWALAATTARRADPKLFGLTLSGCKPLDLFGRLFVLDGATPAQLREHGGGNWLDAENVSPKDWDRVVPENEELLISALADAEPRVRHAAGRILAICRDERGLPAVHEWLKSDPRAPASARRVLAELFGPDWGKPFEARTP